MFVFIAILIAVLGLLPPHLTQAESLAIGGSLIAIGGILMAVSGGILIAASGGFLPRAH